MSAAAAAAIRTQPLLSLKEMRLIASAAPGGSSTCISPAHEHGVVGAHPSTAAGGNAHYKAAVGLRQECSLAVLAVLAMGEEEA